MQSPWHFTVQKGASVSFTDKAGVSQAFVSQSWGSRELGSRLFPRVPWKLQCTSNDRSAPKFPGETTANINTFEGGTFEHAAVIGTNDP